MVGLARSGVAAARDAARPRRGDRPPTRAARGAGGRRGPPRAATAWSCSTAAACVVKSPGVPHEAPVIAAARERGIPVLGELELAWRLLPNRFVAVTGTNGKTTTTELLGAIWRAAGLAGGGGGQRRHAARVAGRARSSPSATVVCEVSSFQLEDAVEFAPDVRAAAEPRPRTTSTATARFEAYREAKLRVFASQSPEQVAVAPAGHRAARAGRAGVEFGDPAALADRARRDPPARAAQPRERDGRRRPRRWRAAWPADAVAEALRTFAGVPHRLEEVADASTACLRQRLEGDQRVVGARAGSRRSRAASTRSSAAASRAAASPGCASRWRRAAAPAT